MPAGSSIRTQRVRRPTRGLFWRRRVAVLVGLDEVRPPRAEARGETRHDVAAIGGLLDRMAVVNASATERPAQNLNLPHRDALAAGFTLVNREDGDRLIGSNLAGDQVPRGAEMVIPGIRQPESRARYILR